MFKEINLALMLLCYKRSLSRLDGPTRHRRSFLSELSYSHRQFCAVYDADLSTKLSLFAYTHYYYIITSVKVPEPSPELSA